MEIRSYQLETTLQTDGANFRSLSLPGRMITFAGNSYYAAAGYCNNSYL